MSTVYAKTPKGQSELESRAGGLKPKVRRVLIVVDGHRDLDEVTRLSACDTESVTESIRQLLNEGYIETAAAPLPVGTLPPAAASSGTEPVAPSAPPPPAATRATPPPQAAAVPPPSSGPNQPPSDPFGSIIKI